MGEDAPDEGTFLVCSCWAVEVLVRQGRNEEARRMFDAVLGCGNDLGLFSEEHDPRTGELLGNVPQAFTHLGIIRAARALDDRA